MTGGVWNQRKVQDQHDYMSNKRSQKYIQRRFGLQRVKGILDIPEMRLDLALRKNRTEWGDGVIR